MLLIPRGEDFPHAIVSKESQNENLKLRNGYLALVRYTGKKGGQKETIPLVSVETIIGRAGEFETEKKAIEYKYSLPGKFPQSVLKHAEEVCRVRPGESS